MVLDAWLMIHDCVSPMTKCSQFLCEHLLPQRSTCENQRENFGTRSMSTNLYRELVSFIKGWGKKKRNKTKLQNKQKAPHALLLAVFYLKYSYRFCFLFWG